MIRMTYWEDLLEKTDKSGNEENIYFEKLTPSVDINIANYEQALDFALLAEENTDVANIAITGPYGAGKSSVIEAYEKKSRLNFLHISLSHYNGTDDIETKKLEEKIVNQLLHQIDYKQIPQTIFRVKDNTSKSSAIAYALGFISLLLLIYGWIHLNEVRTFILSTTHKENLKVFFHSTWLNFIWVVVLAGIGTFLLYKLIKLQIDKKLVKSLKIGGNQVDVSSSSEESYFDRFMNDVIYLFVNSKADVIVFEDLDRFNDATIYEKLQEVNVLVNKRKEIFQNRDSMKLSFLYLIRDDMFKSKDRTKFFDFIIPIIPVMDSSNSYEKFLSTFRSIEILEDFTKSLLKKLSLYIDDYRLLKNIANEYIIYKNRLGEKIDVDKDKLLSLIVYKNLFPSDFSKLQYGNSFLNRVFSKKDELIKLESDQIQNDLEAVNQQINDTRAEFITTYDELDAIYLKNFSDYSIIVSGKEEKDFENRAAFISEIKKVDFLVKKREKKTNYYSIDLIDSDSDYDIRNEFDRLHMNETYKKRYSILTSKSEIAQKELLAKKMRLSNKLIEVQTSSIKDLLINQEISFFKDLISNASEKNNNDKEGGYNYLSESDYFPLLILLLREELIDEKYSDYLTYFYEENLSKDDKTFLRSMYDRNPQPLKYQIQNPDRVLVDMGINDFISYKVKNISLACWILNNKTHYKDYWSALIRDLKENINLDFVFQFYLKSLDNKILYFDIMNQDWPELIIEIISSNELDTNYDKEMYLSDYIQTTSYEIMKKLGDNEKKILTEYIGQSDLLLNKYSSEKKLINKLNELSRLSIRFDNLENDLITYPLIKEIVKFKMFAINKENIRMILKAFNINVNSENFRSSNYSMLKHLNEADITNALLEEHLNQYMTTYLDFGSSTLLDDTTDIIDILNSEAVQNENKINYINRLQLISKITDITEIKNRDLWWKVLNSNNLMATPKNVLSLVEENNWELNDEVIRLINSSENLLVFNASSIGEEISRKIFNIILINDNSLKHDQYISMLKSLNLVYEEGVPEEIPVNRLKILIENSIIKFSEQNLISMRNLFTDQIIDFIYNNFNSYIDMITESDLLDHEEMVKLLQSSRFNPSQNKKIIDNMQYQISIDSYPYKDYIKQYILENNFKEEDLSYILKNYSNMSKSLSDISYKLISNNDRIQRIIEEGLIVPKLLLIKIFKDSEVPLTSRQKLFAHNLILFSEYEVINEIKELSLPEEFISVLSNKKRTIENSVINLEIANQYKEKDWITTLDKESDMITMRGRKIISNGDL